MKFSKKVLHNGLRVITVPMKDNPTVTVLVLVEAGSKYEEKKVNVMFISFNGYGNFIPVEGESQTDAIIRNIVRQLIDPSVDQTKIKCTKKDLDNYIGDSPFVLLIDDFNHLTEKMDEDASFLLRHTFVGKKNRYLVFTTQVPMVLEASIL